MEDTPSPNICPICQGGGQRVQALTIKHHLKFPLNQDVFSDTDYFYCTNRQCSISYFSKHKTYQISDMQSFSQIQKQIICYCFGITETVFNEYIEQDKAEDFFETLDNLAYSTRCYCKAKNPSGKGCLRVFKSLACNYE